MSYVPRPSPSPWSLFLIKTLGINLFSRFRELCQHLWCGLVVGPSISLTHSQKEVLDFHVDKADVDEPQNDGY